MKRIKIILLALISLSYVNCSDDFLNEPPLDRITDNDVWNDKALMDAYLFKIYDNLPWDYLKDFWGAGFGAHRDALTDLARSTYSWTSANNTFRPGIWGTTNNYWPLDYWGYDNIWKINYALENIHDLKPGVLTQDEQNYRLGELYFLRSFSYFALAKRYGGVPLILEPQNPETTPEDELWPTRNTEQEVYDQVIADAQMAFDLMPDRWNSEKGRAPKWAAKALESRAALYAGSIAKYGTVQLEGVVGIQNGLADQYYQIALDAASKLINEGGYSLFEQYPNSADNYYHLFVDETEEETIYAKIWLPYEKGHSYDLYNTPYSYRVDWGSSMSPTKQLLDSYEMLDTGLLPNEAGSGYDPNNPFANRDPRMKGTLLTNMDMFQGSPVETWYATESGGTLDYGRGTGVGKDGIGIHPDATKTGFYVRKYLMDGGTPPYIKQYYSGQDCILFRLGEAYLNAAEAAVELGQDATARSFIEPIRRRAGLQQNIDLSTYSGDELKNRIRNERKIELAFEDHRYWDVRRWRIAADVLSIQVEGIKTLRHLDGSGNATFSYEVFEAETEKMNFYPEQYYLPIGQDRINNNPKLVENPGY